MNCVVGRLCGGECHKLLLHIPAKLVWAILLVNQLSFCSSPCTRHLPSIASDSSVLLALLAVLLITSVHLDFMCCKTAAQILLSFTVKTGKDIWFCRERACIFSIPVPQRCEASLSWLWLPMAFSCELFSFHHLVWEGGKELSCSEETGQRCHCMRLKLKFPGVSLWRTAGF